MSGELNEMSRAIGELQGKIASSEKTNADNFNMIFSKLDDILEDQTSQKLTTTKLSMKVGFITAVLTYGVLEGARLYFRSHGGN